MSSARTHAGAGPMPLTRSGYPEREEAKPAALLLQRHQRRIPAARQTRARGGQELLLELCPRQRLAASVPGSDEATRTRREARQQIGKVEPSEQTPRHHLQIVEARVVVTR